MLKYDTLGANLLKWVTPPAKLLQGTQNRDFMDNWTVHVTISSPGESQGTPGTALGLASWM